LITDYSNKLELSKILESDSFRDKELYQKLLKYIVEASYKSTIPKEVTIAHDVFGKENDFNSAEDTTVRVHMHNLRNKLEHYYQTEGRSDEIKIYIPKGHYQVKFTKNIKTELHPHNRSKNLSIIILSLILSCAIIFIIIDKMKIKKFNQKLDFVKKSDIIWNNFFKNGNQTSVVIGDFFVFHEYDTQLSRSRRIQDYQINIIDTLDGFISDNPDREIENWFLGELPHNCIFNLIDIHPVFLTFNKEFEINFTTEIDINFITNRNLIYIGEFKNLRPLADLISFLPITYKTLPWWHGTISYQEDDSLVTLNTFHDWAINRYVVDLALVAKLPGMNNENYFIFAGFGYNSQIKIIELFSHQSSLSELETQIQTVNGDIPDYFAIVFEITGFDRASTTAEIKFFHEIDKDYYKQYH